MQLGDDEIQAILARLRGTVGSQVIQAGSIPDSSLSAWPDRVTDAVVIIRERRSHYLRRHPEVIGDEPLLIRALLDPDEIHSNATDARVAIIYRWVDDDYALRAPVWVSDRHDRQNSLLSLRRAGTEEVLKGRLMGRERWRR